MSHNGRNTCFPVCAVLNGKRDVVSTTTKTPTMWFVDGIDLALKAAH